MSFFVAILIWYGLIYLIFTYCEFWKNEPKKKDLLMDILLVSPLIIFASFRNNFQYMGDTYIYVSKIEDLPTNILDFFYYLCERTEPLTYIIMYVAKILFNSVHFVLFVLALCFVVPWCVFYRKYSYNYKFCMFLFLAGGYYFSWCCNGIRQGLAMVVCAFMVPLVIEKKYWEAVLLGLCAFLLHNSAIMFFPFLYLCLGKMLNKKVLITIVCFIFLFFYFNDVVSYIFGKFGTEEGYSGTLNYYLDGAKLNLISLCFQSIPAIYSIISYSKIKKCKAPIINLCVNMSLIGVMFNVLAVMGGTSTFGRVAAYFTVFNYLLIPWLIDNTLENRKLKITFTVIFVILFLIYYAFNLGPNLLLEEHIPVRPIIEFFKL